ncbi:class D sortase [Alkalicoccobacillus porphyridii]|uniref:Class D sortase n=1 Tax=Alkalicoccobacillus porphyridii TaxID=2597270 RepID=A0A554A2R7_9BACI|nr:class D sortase [Alkalicoccobacillus porphyridii]TSB47955.1 class D sortase [Alkalicoccobacillus porphyridii]
MKWLSSLFIIAGLVCLAVFGYQYMQTEQAREQSMAEAQESISAGGQSEENGMPINADDFDPELYAAIGTLEIPKLEKTLPIVEGTDPDALDKGIGHLLNSVFPGQGEQIVLSGHRDTVFRNFDQIEIGDQFTVTMPYGTYTYEIRETEIVPEDDTSVIRSMGEEVLVVTTCYPFHYVGNAPERFVTYAYPVDSQ